MNTFNPGGPGSGCKEQDHGTKTLTAKAHALLDVIEINIHFIIDSIKSKEGTGV